MPVLSVRPRGRVAAALALCLLGLSMQADGAPAKKKKSLPPAPKNAALSAALNDKGAEMQKCAIDNALEKGASKVKVDVRVTIDNKGTVVDSQITIDVEGGDKAKVQECVEGVVSTAKFPAVQTRLATAERTWTVSAQ